MTCLLCPKLRPKIAGGAGGFFEKNWEGVCGTLPETLTLSQTKICDFALGYFRPDQEFEILFQT